MTDALISNATEPEGSPFDGRVGFSIGGGTARLYPEELFAVGVVGVDEPLVYTSIMHEGGSRVGEGGIVLCTAKLSGCLEMLY